MPRQRDYSDLSELEREFELEMEDGSPDSLEFELGDDAEADEDREFDQLEASEEEFDSEDESEAMFEDDGPRSREYVERFQELSTREFESSAEVDQAMNEILNDMEREYFFGKLKSGLRKLGKSRILRTLAKKGMRLGVSKFLPGLQGALQLARGNLKGALLNFGKQALGTVVPGGTATLDAVKSLGLGAESEAGGQDAWHNYVGFAREAYEHLADNITENADGPAEATRLANNAIQHAVHTAQARAAGTRDHRERRSNGRRGRTVKLRIARGERLRIIIVGV